MQARSEFDIDTNGEVSHEEAKVLFTCKIEKLPNLLKFTDNIISAYILYP